MPWTQAAALPSSPSAVRAPHSWDVGPCSCSAPPALGHRTSAQVAMLTPGRALVAPQNLSIRHLRSQSEPHAPAAAGGLRPRRWMAEDGASAAGGLPGDTGQGWRTSLWRPLPGTQPAGTCDRLQKPPHLRGGEPQEGSAGLTCSPGTSGHLSSVLSASWLPSPSQALQGLSPLTSESVWKVPCLDLTQGSPKCGLGCGVGC